MIDATGRITTIKRQLEHVRRFTGEIWFVDATVGTSGDGRTPDSAFMTVAEAITAAGAGDAITIRNGTYTEDIDMNLVGLEMWGEIGAILAGTLTISANSCRVCEMIILPTAALGMVITSSYCKIDDTHVIGTPTTAFDIDGGYNMFNHCMVNGHTVTAFDLAASNIHLKSCMAHSNGAATRGFYLSDTAAETSFLEECMSAGNQTAGYETVAGADYNIIVNCVSGAEDGARADAGQFNTWSNFVSITPSQEHEDTYPYFAGEGVASLPITVSNTVTDDSGAGPWSDQDYWGDTVRVMPLSAIIIPWYSLGLYIYAVTASDIQPWQVFFTNANYVSSRNAGNVWDYQETVLTVADGSVFEVSDKVWITGTGHLDGEICNVADVTGDVVTITSETRISADTGLKYDYAGAEQMFVVARSFTPLLDGYDGDFSAGSAKDFARFVWSKQKLLEANSAMIMRMANSSDDLDSSFEVRAIYED